MTPQTLALLAQFPWTLAMLLAAAVVAARGRAPSCY